LPEVARSLARLFDAGAIQGILVVTLSGTEEHVETGVLEQLAATIDVAAVVHLTLGPPDDRARVEIPGVRSLHYPNDRSKVLGRLTSMPRATREEFYSGSVGEAAPPLMAASRASVLDEVFLGVAAPRALSPGEEFVARFAAYTEACRSEIRRVFEQEAPSSQPRLDLERCRWRRGTRVTVRLDAHHVKVSNPVQTFKWNGTWRVLRFDAIVLHEVEVKTLILGFRIAVEGLPIIELRPEIELLKQGRDPKVTPRFSFVEEMAPNSAFASYARADRREVLGRVRSLQIFTGIDVFLDCLSIRPGEQWKPALSGEICKRDIFWLFWSRSARDSQWVDWEWRTALAAKSLMGIQPHPLEPAELAPPPNELSQLQFGAMYEWYLSELRESWLTRRCRTLWRRVRSVLRK
jgi:hypothetical protein